MKGDDAAYHHRWNKKELHHLIEVSLNIAFLQVNLLISLDDFLQPLLSLLTLLELEEILPCHFSTEVHCVLIHEYALPDTIWS